MRRKLHLFLFVLSIFAFCSCSKEESKFETQVKPLIWGCDIIKAQEKLVDFSSRTKQPHPLDIGRYLFYSTHKFNQTGDSRYKKLSMGYLDLISEMTKDTVYFKNNTFRYNFKHDNLKAGWWSGMANAAIMLGLTYADEVYETENNILVEKLIKNLTTDYTKGGSLKTIDDESSWVFEYAWPKMNGSSFKSVLNGFMFTLVCIETTNQLKPNPILEDLFKKGLNGLKSEINQYYFDNYDWTKYSLIPSIEAPHYSIYVIMLLESLNETSKEEWLVLNLQKRREILKNSYRIDISEHEKHTILFSQIGPPHPYWLDIYPIKIRLNFEDGQIIEKIAFPPRDFSNPISARGFLRCQLTSKELEELTSLLVIADYSGLEQVIYSIEKNDLRSVSENDLYPKEISNKIWANYHGKFENSYVVIKPEKKYDTIAKDYRNNIAQILMQPIQHQSLKENEHIAFQFESDFDILAHKFVIYTTEGGVHKRTYIPIKDGKNTIIINSVGFMGYKSTDHIKLIVWQISTGSMTEKGIVKIEKVFSVKNNFQLQNLMSDKEYTFEEKKTNGNIY